MCLQNGKASGLEDICAELLKAITTKLIRILTYIIINQCLNGHPTPTQWKITYVFSIHKNGEKRLQVLQKHFSDMMMSHQYVRIRDMIEEEYGYFEEEEQSGFRVAPVITTFSVLNKLSKNEE